MAVNGKLCGYFYYSTRRSFTDHSRPERRWFVIYDPDDPAWGVDAPTAQANFGPPSTTLEYGTYRKLIWDHDISPQLGPPHRDP
jgi:hypothetical protein